MEEKHLQMSADSRASSTYKNMPPIYSLKHIPHTGSLSLQGLLNVNPYNVQPNMLTFHQNLMQRDISFEHCLSFFSDPVNMSWRATYRGWTTLGRKKVLRGS